MLTQPSDSASEQLNPLRYFNLRLTLVKVFFLAFFALLVARLVQVQIIDAEKYEQIARRQYETKLVLPAARGKIYDRNGNILVSNAMFVSYGADPKIVGEKALQVAEKFGRVFGKPWSHYLEKLRTKGRFVWMERRVSPALARRMHLDRLKGVVRLDEPKRLYHYGEVAGSLLGFTDIDNKGLSGIELQYDWVLSGTDGYVVMQRDGLGHTKPSVDYPRVEPVNGHDVVLTIDIAFQSIAEEELGKGIELHEAEGGLVIILDPKTGELLALAQWPAVNPNEFYRYDAASQKIRAITDTFEPGSLFKLVTATAALQNDLVTPDRRFFAENGKYVVSLRAGKKRVIKDTHEYGWISFAEAMEHSSNIVMAKVSDLVGAGRLYSCARDFGFGTATGIDLPGEVAGKVKKPSEWSGTTLNTMAYGYEIAATPLQIASAYSAVANGGTLMKPTVLRQIVSGPSGTTNEDLEIERRAVRRAVSPEVSRVLTELFVGVVNRGTGMRTRIEEVQIAGKTGTSRKYVNGKYQLGSYVSSFVGYFPADDPTVLCLVMVDNPHAVSYYGGETAGPVFRAVAERIINTGSAIMKTVVARSAGDGVDPNGVVPNVRNLKVDIATRLLESHGFVVDLFGHGEVVVRQVPCPGQEAEPASMVRLVTAQYSEGLNPADGLIGVPDLRGITIRRAVNRLTLDNLRAAVVGSGVVVSQRPGPGTRVRDGAKVKLWCEPKSGLQIGSGRDHDVEKNVSRPG